MTTTLSATPRVTRPLVRFASLITLITALGTAGYTFIEGWTLADALYMTVITRCRPWAMARSRHCHRRADYSRPGSSYRVWAR